MTRAHPVALLVVLWACSSPEPRVSVAAGTLEVLRGGSVSVPLEIDDAPLGTALLAVEGAAGLSVRPSVLQLTAGQVNRPAVELVAAAQTATGLLDASLVLSVAGRDVRTPLQLRVLDGHALTLTLDTTRFVVRQGTSLAARLTATDAQGQLPAAAMATVVGLLPAGVEVAASAPGEVSVRAAADAAVGRFTVTMRVRAGDAVGEAPLDIEVLTAAAPDFELVAPTSVVLRRPATTFTVSVRGTSGFTSPVTLESVALAGLRVAPITLAPGRSADLTVSLDETAADGSSELVLVGEAAGRQRLARVRVQVTRSGTLDDSFGAGGASGYRAGVASTVLPLADGRVLFGGYLVLGYGQTVPVITRLTEQGAVDPTFGPEGLVELSAPGSSAQVAHAAESGDSLIVSVDSTLGQAETSVLARLGADGTLDSDFGHFEADVDLPQVNDLLASPSGAVIVSGVWLTNGRGFARRLTSTGQLDPTFDLAFDGEYVTAVRRYADGALAVLTGLDSGQGARLYRYLANGQLDASFGQQGAVKIASDAPMQWSQGVGLASDGSAVLLLFRADDNRGRNGRAALVHVLADGTLDPSYGDAGTRVFADAWHQIAVAADGSASLAACRSQTSGRSAWWLQVMPNGEPDPAYETSDHGVGVQLFPLQDACVRQLALDARGKLLVAGGIDEPWGDWLTARLIR